MDRYTSDELRRRFKDLEPDTQIWINYEPVTFLGDYADGITVEQPDGEPRRYAFAELAIVFTVHFSEEELQAVSSVSGAPRAIVFTDEEYQTLQQFVARGYQRSQNEKPLLEKVVAGAELDLFERLLLPAEVGSHGHRDPLNVVAARQRLAAITRVEALAHRFGLVEETADAV